MTLRSLSAYYVPCWMSFIVDTMGFCAFVLYLTGRKDRRTSGAFRIRITTYDDRRCNEICLHYFFLLGKVLFQLAALLPATWGSSDTGSWEKHLLLSSESVALFPLSTPRRHVHTASIVTPQLIKHVVTSCSTRLFCKTRPPVYCLRQLIAPWMGSDAFVRSRVRHKPRTRN